MKEQFVPYKLALKLKELGFDKECIAYYIKERPNKIKFKIWQVIDPYFPSFVKNTITDPVSSNCTAPLWQQAFGYIWSKIDDTNYTLDFNGDWNLFEHDGNNDVINIISTKQACLEKLIELVEGRLES